MENKELALHLRQLEVELLSEATRTNLRRLNEIIADEYLEIGKSGKIYSKPEVIEALKKEKYKEIKISGFEITPITDSVILAVYTAYQNRAEKNTIVRSVRSSIWKLFGAGWKIIFHQGTIVSD